MEKKSFQFPVLLSYISLQIVYFGLLWVKSNQITLFPCFTYTTQMTTKKKD